MRKFSIFLAWLSQMNCPSCNGIVIYKKPKAILHEFEYECISCGKEYLPERRNFRLRSLVSVIGSIIVFFIILFFLWLGRAPLGKLHSIGLMWFYVALFCASNVVLMIVLKWLKILPAKFVEKKSH